MLLFRFFNKTTSPRRGAFRKIHTNKYLILYHSRPCRAVTDLEQYSSNYFYVVRNVRIQYPPAPRKFLSYYTAGYGPRTQGPDLDLDVFTKKKLGAGGGGGFVIIIE